MRFQPDGPVDRSPTVFYGEGRLFSLPKVGVGGTALRHFPASFLGDGIGFCGLEHGHLHGDTACSNRS